MNIVSPANFPSGDRRTVRVALPPAPVALVLVDCDGDVWRQVGTTQGGEPRMVCDTPQAATEQGDGVSYPWTPAAITAWFGPVRTLGGAA